MNEAKCSLTVSIVNDRLYAFGGYVGEGKISHRIEVFNEGFLHWELLSVELPFSLEGLTSINICEDEILIIGGKGLEGSKKEIIRYTAKELENDSNT